MDEPPYVVICNLHNIKTNRYHPISFRYAPPPSGDLPNGTARFKSIGHHTDGFNTRDEAITFCNGTLRAYYKEPVVVNTEKDFVWDGEGTPAMVIWFNTKGIPVL